MELINTIKTLLIHICRIIVGLSNCSTEIICKYECKCKDFLDLAAAVCSEGLCTETSLCCGCCTPWLLSRLREEADRRYHPLPEAGGKHVCTVVSSLSACVTSTDSRYRGPIFWSRFLPSAYSCQNMGCTAVDAARVALVPRKLSSPYPAMRVPSHVASVGEETTWCELQCHLAMQKTSRFTLKI